MQLLPMSIIQAFSVQDPTPSFCLMMTSLESAVKETSQLRLSAMTGSSLTNIPLPSLCAIKWPAMY
jgi:hypothetical protein